MTGSHTNLTYDTLNDTLNDIKETFLGENSDSQAGFMKLKNLVEVYVQDISEDPSFSELFRNFFHEANIGSQINNILSYFLSYETSQEAVMELTNDFIDFSMLARHSDIETKELIFKLALKYELFGSEKINFDQYLNLLVRDNNVDIDAFKGPQNESLLQLVITTNNAEATQFLLNERNGSLFFINGALETKNSEIEEIKATIANYQTHLSSLEPGAKKPSRFDFIQSIKMATGNLAKLAPYPIINDLYSIYGDDSEVTIESLIDTANSHLENMIQTRDDIENFLIEKIKSLFEYTKENSDPSSKQNIIELLNNSSCYNLVIKDLSLHQSIVAFQKEVAEANFEVLKNAPIDDTSLQKLIDLSNDRFSAHNILPNIDNFTNDYTDLLNKHTDAILSKLNEYQPHQANRDENQAHFDLNQFKEQLIDLTKKFSDASFTVENSARLLSHALEHDLDRDWQIHFFDDYLKSCAYHNQELDFITPSWPGNKNLLQIGAELNHDLTKIIDWMNQENTQPTIPNLKTITLALEKSVEILEEFSNQYEENKDFAIADQIYSSIYEKYQNGDPKIKELESVLNLFLEATPDTLNESLIRAKAILNNSQRNNLFFSYQSLKDNTEDYSNDLNFTVQGVTHTVSLSDFKNRKEIGRGGYGSASRYEYKPENGVFNPEFIKLCKEIPNPNNPDEKHYWFVIKWPEQGSLSEFTHEADFVTQLNELNEQENSRPLYNKATGAEINGMPVIISELEYYALDHQLKPISSNLLELLEKLQASGYNENIQISNKSEEKILRAIAKNPVAEISRLMGSLYQSVQKFNTKALHLDIATRNTQLSINAQGEVECKLIDFGYSKLLDSRGFVDEKRDTGPIEWMSKKRLKGEHDKKKRLDATADLYSYRIAWFEIFAVLLNITLPNQEKLGLEHIVNFKKNPLEYREKVDIARSVYHKGDEAALKHYVSNLEKFLDETFLKENHLTFDRNALNIVRTLLNNLRPYLTAPEMTLAHDMGFDAAQKDAAKFESCFAHSNQNTPLIDEKEQEELILDNLSIDEKEQEELILDNPSIDEKEGEESISDNLSIDEKEGEESISDNPTSDSSHENLQKTFPMEVTEYKNLIFPNDQFNKKINLLSFGRALFLSQSISASVKKLEAANIDITDILEAFPRGVEERIAKKNGKDFQKILNTFNEQHPKETNPQSQAAAKLANENILDGQNLVLQMKELLDDKTSEDLISQIQKFTKNKQSDLEKTTSQSVDSQTADTLVTTLTQKKSTAVEQLALYKDIQSKLDGLKNQRERFDKHIKLETILAYAELAGEKISPEDYKQYKAIMNFIPYSINFNNTIKKWDDLIGKTEQRLLAITSITESLNIIKNIIAPPKVESALAEKIMGIITNIANQALLIPKNRKEEAALTIAKNVIVEISKSEDPSNLFALTQKALSNIDKKSSLTTLLVSLSEATKPLFMVNLQEKLQTIRDHIHSNINPCYQDLQEMMANEYTRNIIVSDSPLLKEFSELNNQSAELMANTLIAKELTLISNFDCYEYYNSWGADKKQTPTITDVIEYSNHLTYFIVSDILSKKSIDERTLALEHWLRVAEKCLDNPSVTSSNTIIALGTAFNKNQVLRLRKTFDGLSEHGKEIYKRIEQFSNPSHSYGTYTEHTKTKLTTPLIAKQLVEVNGIKESSTGIGHHRFSLHRYIEQIHPVFTKIQSVTPPTQTSQDFLDRLFTSNTNNSEAVEKELSNTSLSFEPRDNQTILPSTLLTKQAIYAEQVTPKLSIKQQASIAETDHPLFIILNNESAFLAPYLQTIQNAELGQIKENINDDGIDNIQHSISIEENSEVIDQQILSKITEYETDKTKLYTASVYGKEIAFDQIPEDQKSVVATQTEKMDFNSAFGKVAPCLIQSLLAEKMVAVRNNHEEESASIISLDNTFILDQYAEDLFSTNRRTHFYQGTPILDQPPFRKALASVYWMLKHPENYVLEDGKAIGDNHFYIELTKIFINQLTGNDLDIFMTFIQSHDPHATEKISILEQLPEVIRSEIENRRKEETKINPVAEKPTLEKQLKNVINEFFSSEMIFRNNLSRFADQFLTAEGTLKEPVTFLNERAKYSADEMRQLKKLIYPYAIIAQHPNDMNPPENSHDAVHAILKQLRNDLLDTDSVFFKSAREATLNYTNFVNFGEYMKSKGGLKKIHHHNADYSISDFAIQPLQRLCKYPLLLKEIAAHTEDPALKKDVLAVLGEVNAKVLEVNNLKRRQDESLGKEIATRGLLFINKNVETAIAHLSAYDQSTTSDSRAKAIQQIITQLNQRFDPNEKLTYLHSIDSVLEKDSALKNDSALKKELEQLKLLLTDQAKALLQYQQKFSDQIIFDHHPTKQELRDQFANRMTDMNKMMAGKEKSGGKNDPGEFGKWYAVDYFVNEKDTVTEITQNVLAKHDYKNNKNIAEVVGGRIMSKLAKGDVIAATYFATRPTRPGDAISTIRIPDDTGENIYVISIGMDNYEDLFTILGYKERPSAVGSINKEQFERGFCKTNPDGSFALNEKGQKQCNFANFETVIAASLLPADFDVHTGNLSLRIHPISKDYIEERLASTWTDLGVDEKFKDAEFITHIAALNIDAIDEEKLKAFAKAVYDVPIATNASKKDMAQQVKYFLIRRGLIQAELVKIDHGGCLRKLDSDVGMHAITRHMMLGMEPTDHFRTLPRDLKVADAFAKELERQASISLDSTIEEAMKEVCQFYGPEPIMEFAREIHGKDFPIDNLMLDFIKKENLNVATSGGKIRFDTLNKDMSLLLKNEIVNKTVHFAQQRFKERQESFEELAREIKLSLAIQKNQAGHYELLDENFKSFIQTHPHYLLKGDFHFRGADQRTVIPLGFFNAKIKTKIFVHDELTDLVNHALANEEKGYLPLLAKTAIDHLFQAEQDFSILNAIFSHEGLMKKRDLVMSALAENVRAQNISTLLKTPIFSNTTHEANDHKKNYIELLTRSTGNNALDLAKEIITNPSLMRDSRDVFSAMTAGIHRNHDFYLDLNNGIQAQLLNESNPTQQAHYIELWIQSTISIAKDGKLEEYLESINRIVEFLSTHDIYLRNYIQFYGEGKISEFNKAIAKKDSSSALATIINDVIDLLNKITRPAPTVSEAPIKAEKTLSSEEIRQIALEKHRQEALKTEAKLTSFTTADVIAKANEFNQATRYAFSKTDADLLEKMKEDPLNNPFKKLELISNNISYDVANNILSIDSAAGRAKVIEYYIAVMQKTMEMNDFATTAAILNGLKTTLPLDKTRAALSRNARLVEGNISELLNNYSSFYGAMLNHTALIIPDHTIFKSMIKYHHNANDETKVTKAISAIASLKTQLLEEGVVDPTHPSLDSDKKDLNALSSRLQNVKAIENDVNTAIPSMITFSVINDSNITFDAGMKAHLSDEEISARRKISMETDVSRLNSIVNSIIKDLQTYTATKKWYGDDKLHKERKKILLDIVTTLQDPTTPYASKSKQGKLTTDALKARQEYLADIIENTTSVLYQHHNQKSTEDTHALQYVKKLKESTDRLVEAQTKLENSLMGLSVAPRAMKT